MKGGIYHQSTGKSSGPSVLDYHCKPQAGERLWSHFLFPSPVPVSLAGGMEDFLLEFCSMLSLSMVLHGYEWNQQTSQKGSEGF